MSVLVPVVLCGGAGVRLWPVSREALPKPFIRLPDPETGSARESLLAKTLRRAFAAAGGARALAVTNREYFFLVRDECDALGEGRLDFLLEPVGRNTAPAICAAALLVAREHGEDAIMLVLPADHMISGGGAFADALDEARRLAAQGWLVTFGVQPTRAETDFGYLEQGEALSSGATRVTRFVEKPDAATAEHYAASGAYRWNSGLFCFSAGSALGALQKHAPDVLRAVEAALAVASSEPCTLGAIEFAAAPDISFDYAVMEHAERVAMVHAGFGWSDIGSWAAVAELTEPDTSGNRVQGEAVMIDSARCFVQTDERVVAVIGVADLLIVDTPDALLVAHRERAREVKLVVQQLKGVSHYTVRHHRTVRQPWGTYTVLEEGEGSRIRRIVVRPGATLSLQLHRRRSEHWVVLSGNAELFYQGCKIVIGPHESAFIRAGEKHRLTNPGPVDCVMIEVQTGDYVGDDDVEHLDDR
jgi:mannose-1-phosphate guanylyltransferase/mannose-6-phosphate isomerase